MPTVQELKKLALENLRPEQRPALDDEPVCAAVYAGATICLRARGHSHKHAAFSSINGLLQEWDIEPMELVVRVLDEAGVQRTAHPYIESTNKRETKPGVEELTPAARVSILALGEKQAIDRLTDLQQEHGHTLDFVREVAKCSTKNGSFSDGAAHAKLLELAALAERHVEWWNKGKGKTAYGRGHKMANPQPPNTNYCLICGSCSWDDVTRPCRLTNR